MNTVDVLVLVVLLLNGLIGAFRGFLWQAFRIGSLILALWLGNRYAANLADGVLTNVSALDATGRRVVAYVAILIAVYGVMHLIGAAFRRLVEKARLTSADRALGFLLGGLKGALFVILAFQILFVFFPMLPSDVQTQLVGGSQGTPAPSQAFLLHRKLLAQRLSDMMPDEMRKEVLEGLKAVDARR